LPGGRAIPIIRSVGVDLWFGVDWSVLAGLVNTESPLTGLRHLDRLGSTLHKFLVETPVLRSPESVALPFSMCNTTGWAVRRQSCNTAVASVVRGNGVL